MDLSILSLLAQATLVAKAVLVVLLFMSVFSWALMFRKWMNIRAALKKAADGMDRFNHAWTCARPCSPSAAIPTPHCIPSPTRA